MKFKIKMKNIPQFIKQLQELYDDLILREFDYRIFDTKTEDLLEDYQ